MNSSRCGVQEDGAVGAGRLRDRVALHVRRPGAAVRVVLERVEVARLGAGVERDLRHLAGRTGVVRGELAALLCLPVAAPACREDDRRGLEGVVAAPGAPAVRRALEVDQRGLRERLGRRRLDGVAQGGRDRMSGAVADLQQPPARRAAAACQPVAAVLGCEPDAELLEPVDRVGSLGREDLDQSPVGGLVRALPDVLGVLLGRVVVPERGLDAALRLRRVARLQRSLGRERDTRPGALGRDRGREPGGTASDHEHVEGHGRCHDPRTLPEKR